MTITKESDANSKEGNRKAGVLRFLEVAAIVFSVLTGSLNTAAIAFKGGQILQTINQNADDIKALQPLEPRMAKVETWQAARPSFVTEKEQELALLKQEKLLRDMFVQKMEEGFKEIRSNQQEQLRQLSIIDKKLAEHMVAKP